LFRLKELPFRLSPDPQFLYLSKHHARAKAYMESTIWFTDGFVVITGEIGSGKTTLIETFLRELDKDVVVAQLNQTQISPLGFLQGVLVQFGFSPFKMNKAELLATINNFLIEQYAAGRKVVLVIDEAQNLSNRVLEEVRLLSGVETTKDKTLRIILAGQPELGGKLDSTELVQLAQRVRLRFHLSSLSKDDTYAYVSPAALHEVCRYTGGGPRLINTLCDTAMMGAFVHDKDTIDVPEIQAAVQELQWIEYAARTNRMARTEMIPAALRNTSASAILGWLIVETDGQAVAEKEVRAGRLIIGRTSENDLQIDSKYISRHHCQILATPEVTVIEDLNSTNGIVIRGSRVRRHMLNDGDVIVIGRHKLTWSDREHPPGVAPPGSQVADHGATHPPDEFEDAAPQPPPPVSN
jgi:type II secretory pathway predicted ATPase ExeA